MHPERPPQRGDAGSSRVLPATAGSAMVQFSASAGERAWQVFGGFARAVVAFVLMVLTALAWALLAARPAYAADDQIDSFTINYDMQPTGVLKVKETITWRFGSNSGRHGIHPIWSSVNLIPTAIRSSSVRKGMLEGSNGLSDVLTRPAHGRWGNLRNAASRWQCVRLLPGLHRVWASDDIGDRSDEDQA
jgi:Predicted membrane protein (DUF2207) N-terminal domain